MNKELFFLKLAKLTSELGTCPRARVGAVVVVGDRLVSTGYNGAARGEKHCGCILDEGGRCVKAVHAEANTVINAAYHGISTKDGVMYCTHSPCDRCLPLLINAGIKQVIYIEDYNHRVASLQHNNQINIEKSLYFDI